MNNKLTIRVRDIGTGIDDDARVAPSDRFLADVIIGGTVYATVTGETKTAARQAAKMEAEQMGLVNL